MKGDAQVLSYLQAQLKPSLSGQLGLQTKLNWKPAATAGQADDITLALPQPETPETTP